MSKSYIEYLDEQHTAALNEKRDTCHWDFRGVEFHGGANAECRAKVRAFRGECSYHSDMEFCPYCGKPIEIKGRKP